MKNWMLCCFCFCGVVFGSPIQDRTIDAKALSELTTFLEIPEGADLVVETQKNWLRKAGQERWEMTELSSEQKTFVLDWTSNQGLFSSWEPTEKSYDKALILGASTSHMQTRLEFLKNLWDQGIRFDEIVWLTGDRPLDERIDGLTDRCLNESEASHIIWEEASLPEEMRTLPVSFIAVPMKEEGKRPNTADTIVAWLEKSPKPCKALFVSDQPFCGYQFSIIKGVLPEDFLFDVVGHGADPTSHPAAAAITLDSIARWIYADSCQ